MDSESYNGMPIHYRYSEFNTEHGVTIVEHQFVAVRETARCYFLIHKHELNAYERDWYNVKQYRVLKGALRGRAHPTREKALQAYRARKYSQLHHCELGVAVAKQALKATDNLKVIDGGKLDAGRPEYFNNFIWD